jgi:hypothetical protein
VLRKSSITFDELCVTVRTVMSSYIEEYFINMNFMD